MIELLVIYFVGVIGTVMFVYLSRPKYRAVDITLTVLWPIFMIAGLWKVILED